MTPEQTERLRVIAAEADQRVREMSSAPIDRNDPGFLAAFAMRQLRISGVITKAAEEIRAVLDEPTE